MSLTAHGQECGIASIPSTIRLAVVAPSLDVLDFTTPQVWAGSFIGLQLG